MLAKRAVKSRTSRIPPVLSDGTALSDLIDLENREISMRVLSDPEVYRLELRKIFARTWIPLGHVSEVPNPGDFVQRYIGEDRVIVTRGNDGGVHALLNVCAHRGMEVCWADEGSASSFRCPYHGWVFGLDGRLLGAAYEKKAYGELDKARYGLRKARVSLRKGVIFGNFAEDGPSLDEYLGDLAWYFDRSFEGAEEYEVLTPPARLILKANWKTIADQNAGDLYHIAGAHKAVIELGFMPNVDSQLDVVKVGFPGLGHNVFGINPELAFLPEGTGMTDEQKYGFDGKSFINFIFPITQAGGMKGQFVQLSAFTPKGPAAFEVNQLSLCKKDLPDEIKATIRRQNMITVALLQDDADSVQSIQRAATGAVGQTRTMKYNALLGEKKPAGWPGPGTVYAGFSRDDTNWEFWLRWYDLLSSE